MLVRVHHDGMRFFAIFVAVLLLCSSPAVAAGRCAMADCYNVHGRLRVDSDLQPTLWSVDTERFFNIALHDAPHGEEYFWPPTLAETAGPGTEIFGDFRICPLTSA